MANIKPLSSLNSVNKKIVKKKKQVTSKSKKNNKLTSDLSVSIIASTNKPKYIDNLFDNYNRQNYKNKELIIILNNNKIDIEACSKEAEKYKDVRVFQIDEKKDLSDCINFGVTQSSSDLIAKFDDDDYYGPNYLNEAVEAIVKSKAGVVGKAKYYAYFENIERLGLRNGGPENSFTNYIHGPTLLMRREIISKYKFKNMGHGADQVFLKDCIKDGIKIYCTSKKNFIYIRHTSLKDHTWKIKNQEFMRKFKLLPATKDYKKYAL